MGAQTTTTNVAKVVKVLLFSANLFFLIGGGLLLGLGIWIRVDGDSYYTVLGKGGPEIPSDIMIAVGAAVILISFLGCLGALLESRCLLLGFIVILCIIVAGQIVLVSLSLLYKDELTEKVTERVTENFQKYYGVDNHQDVTNSVDKIQGELKCCGTFNYTSWNESMYGETNRPDVLPLTCCKSDGATADCKKIEPRPTNVYTSGCIDELKSWANTKFVIMISVGIAVAIFEILGICFALMVLKYI